MADTGDWLIHYPVQSLFSALLYHGSCKALCMWFRYHQSDALIPRTGLHSKRKKAWSSISLEQIIQRQRSLTTHRCEQSFPDLQAACCSWQEMQPFGEPSSVVWPWELSLETQPSLFSNHCLDPIINTILLNLVGMVSLLCNWTMTDKFLNYFKWKREGEWKVFLHFKLINL